MIPIFQWIAWGNIFKYAGEILAANEFHDLDLSCGKNGETFIFIIKLLNTFVTDSLKFYSF